MQLATGRAEPLAKATCTAGRVARGVGHLAQRNQSLGTKSSTSPVPTPMLVTMRFGTVLLALLLMCAARGGDAVYNGAEASAADIPGRKSVRKCANFRCDDKCDRKRGVL